MLITKHKANFKQPKRRMVYLAGHSSLWMASVTQWGLQLWGCCTALLAAQDAFWPGLLSLAASAIMYAVAKVSPAPFVSTAVTCAQHDWQPIKYVMVMMMMTMTMMMIMMVMIFYKDCVETSTAMYPICH